MHDELIEANISLTGNDDLLFQQIPLPEQLLQSDDKDDDIDILGGIHRNGLNRDEGHSPKPADGEKSQDQNKVSFN